MANKVQEEKCVDYYVEMTNEEYRVELQKMIKEITDLRILRYIHIIISDIINE